MNENVVLVPEEEAARVSAVKLSWAGLLGGMVVAVGVFLLLTVLGLAVGLSSFDPGDSVSTIKSVGIGTGIWSIVVSIIALFVGGVVAARTSGILDRPAGAIHGAVLWSLATVLSIVLVSGIVKNLVRGAVDTAGMAVGAAAQTAEGAGIDASTLIGPINERLRAEGKPTMTPDQLQSVLSGATAMAMREGRLDKDILAASITQNTPLSGSDARVLADRIEAQTSTTAQDVKVGAFKAADAVGKAMWWVFLSMLLGLIAAVLGATLGVSRRQRIAAGVERPQLATTREAHL